MKSSLDLLRVATRAAERAAEYLRTVERPRDPAAWQTKGPHDFVSEADRRIGDRPRLAMANQEQLIANRQALGEIGIVGMSSRFEGPSVSPYTLELEA